MVGNFSFLAPSIDRESLQRNADVSIKFSCIKRGSLIAVLDEPVSGLNNE